MKQQDIAIVIIVVFVVGVGTFLLTNALIKPGNKTATAEVVTPISPEFQLPSSDVFNADAINPTVRIQIAPNSNGQPFEDQAE